jgi:tetratricopeptide (TPR) repeat protein
MAAYVTLCRGLDRAAVMTAVEEEKQALGRPSAGDPAPVADALQEALPGEDGAVAPVLPDMIGEAVILQSLRASRADGATVVGRAAQFGVVPVATTVIRAAQDYAHASHPEPVQWFDSLVAQVGGDLDTLMAIADTLPEASLALAEPAARIADQVVTKLKLLATSTGEREDILLKLSSSLNTLAARLPDLGRREDALATIEEAARLYRNLAAARPDAFRPDLAASLTNLANALSDLGRREDALAAAEEAVEIRRDLAAARPDAFRPNLANSLNKLAKSLSALGRREDALAAVAEAVATLAPFFLAHPAAFSSWMKPIVHNYSELSANIGQQPQGSPHFQRMHLHG